MSINFKVEIKNLDIILKLLQQLKEIIEILEKTEISINIEESSIDSRSIEKIAEELKILACSHNS